MDEQELRSRIEALEKRVAAAEMQAQERPIAIDLCKLLIAQVTVLCDWNQKRNDGHVLIQDIEQVRKNTETIQACLLGLGLMGLT